MRDQRSPLYCIWFDSLLFISVSLLLAMRAMTVGRLFVESQVHWQFCGNTRNQHASKKGNEFCLGGRHCKDRSKCGFPTKDSIVTENQIALRAFARRNDIRPAGICIHIELAGMKWEFDTLCAQVSLRALCPAKYLSTPFANM